MIKRTIPYTDLDGNPVSDEFHFNFTKVEALEFAAKYKGSPVKVLTDAFEGIRTENNADENEVVVMKFFRDLIASSVGVRSESGKSFLKNDQITSEFMNSNAYSEFFFEILADEKLAIEFFNGVFPEGMANLNPLSSNKVEYTEEQLLNMADEDFIKAVGGNALKMSQEHLMIAMKRRNRQKAA
jgi:hypothetical protein